MSNKSQMKTRKRKRHEHDFVAFYLQNKFVYVSVKWRGSQAEERREGDIVIISVNISINKC